jgi:glycosyltransferase involved in cell wall biosynthesis
MKNDKKKYICIPYKEYTGGPGTFISQLKKSNKKWTITHQLNHHANVILVIVYFNPVMLLIHKLFYSSKVVLRLDGFQLPSNQRSLKGKLLILITNLGTWFIYKFIADYIVYQSNFSKVDIIKNLGYSSKPSKIIYNGIYTSIKCSKKLLNTVELAYWGSSITRSQVELLVKVSNVINSKFKMRLTIIGKIVDDISSIQISTEIINHIGFIPNNDMSTYFYRTHIFLMIKGSPSPNALVECLANCIPVVGFSNKGNAEIISSEDGILFPLSNSMEVNVNNFVNGINDIVSNYNYFVENSHKNYNRLFTSDILQENYSKIFEELI